MLTYIAVMVTGFLMAADPQAAATNGKIFKSDKGTCQAALPSDWTIDTSGPATAADQKKTVNVMVLHEADAKVQKRSEAVIKGVYDATKIFENSDQRLFIESTVPGFGPNPPKRKWESLVPTGPKGACQVIITMKDGASEAVARGIVMSLKPAQ